MSTYTLSNFQAWQSFFTGGPPTLQVVGEVHFTSAGSTPLLFKHVPQGFVPNHRRLDLLILPPLGDVAAMPRTTEKVSYSERTTDRVESVTIMPDGLEVPVIPIEAQLAAATAQLAAVTASRLATADGFNARQVAGVVTIRAWGSKPQLQDEVRFTEAPLTVFPPQYQLLLVSPDLGNPAETDFSVATAFPATEPVAEVVVFDAAGRHVIPVEHARD